MTDYHSVVRTFCLTNKNIIFFLLFKLTLYFSLLKGTRLKMCYCLFFLGLERRFRSCFLFIFGIWGCCIFVFCPRSYVFSSLSLSRRHRRPSEPDSGLFQTTRAPFLLTPSSSIRTVRIVRIIRGQRPTKCLRGYHRK